LRFSFPQSPPPHKEKDQSSIKQRVGKSMLKEAPSPPVMTIGHSTHTLEEFISLLQAHAG
jgi:hypothetical protein